MASEVNLSESQVSIASTDIIARCPTQPNPSLGEKIVASRPGDRAEARADGFGETRARDPPVPEPTIFWRGVALGGTTGHVQARAPVCDFCFRTAHSAAFPVSPLRYASINRQDRLKIGGSPRQDTQTQVSFSSELFFCEDSEYLMHVSFSEGALGDALNAA